MKRVMFFAHDPGGANAIAPLIPEFENPLVFAKGPAVRILPAAQGLPDNVLVDLSPDFLVTGTSANDFTERNLWKQAEALGIPSMAILDSWVNYGVRFSKFGLDELHLFVGKCDYTPRFVCVPDDLAKEDAIIDGIPEEIIISYGNPHFEKMAAKARNTAGISDGKTILFASQPFADVYYKGSQEIVLQDLVTTVGEYNDAHNDLKLMIRKHPKEPAEKFTRYLGKHVFMDTNTDVYDSVREAEILVSVNSMVLIEALFLSKKIISYQPKTKNGKDDFILTKNGTIPFIDNTTDFRGHFAEMLIIKDYSPKTDIKCSGIIERLKTFIKEQMYG